MTDLIKVERLTKDGIVDYYKDCGSEYFDCGEGYYEDAATIYIELDSGKIYEVNMEAECEGNKTDYGERIYFVDKITSVTFKEADELWIISQQLEQLKYEKKEVTEKFEAICNKISSLEDRKLDLENEVEGK